MVQRDDGFQDEADKVNEEVKAERDAVEMGAHVGKGSRPPVVLDDPAAVEKGPPETVADVMAARHGRDRAEGRPQTGVPSDPDPRSPESGLRASSVAAIAYDAVQRYKEQIGQTYVWWVNLEEPVQSEIHDNVAAMFRGENMNVAANHSTWVKNQLARGVTVEDDPRVGQAWGEIDPVERRKVLIFVRVVSALLQPV